jgi:hypothetical protein
VPLITARAPCRSQGDDVDGDDPTSCVLLAKHAHERGGQRDGFVFSDDGGATTWKPNRVTKAFIRYRRSAGLVPSGCTTCATS